MNTKILRNLLLGLIVASFIPLFTMCKEKTEPESTDSAVSGESTGVAGELMKRDEIEDKYKWNLKDLYENEDLWEQDYKWVESMLPKLKGFAGKLGMTANNLYEFLKLDEEIGVKFEHMRMYASLSKDLDLRDTKYQGLYGRIMNLATELSSAGSFVRPEILAIPESKLNGFLNSKEELKMYRHYFDDILRMKKHTLTKEQEELMSFAGPMGELPYTAFSLWSNADIQYPEIKDENGQLVRVSAGRYYSGLISQDREFRERTYRGFYKPFVEHKNMLGALFNGQIKSLIFNAKARKYNSTREAALDANNIPVAVYDNLVNTVNENLKSLHRWASIRKKVLKLNDFHSYDTYVSLFPGVEKKYTYDEAVDLCLKALKPLGEDYISKLDNAFKNRWVDVYETTGKRSGAYSTGAAKGVHPYVLMNWNFTLDEVFTLAHEMGHNMHSYYSSLEQPYPYADYPIFLAEVASTMNEALLLQYMIDNSKSKDEKLALIEHYLMSIQKTFFRQTRFGEFEMLVNDLAEKGEALTPDKLSELFGEMYKRYWGPEMVLDDEEALCWARIPHFYYNFYVYQYATSFAASEALAEKVSREGQPAIDLYLNFLKSGRSEYAIPTLKKAGVDMTSAEPIMAVIKKMNTLMDEMEKLMNE